MTLGVSWRVWRDRKTLDPCIRRGDEKKGLMENLGLLLSQRNMTYWHRFDSISLGGESLPRRRLRAGGEGDNLTSWFRAQSPSPQPSPPGRGGQPNATVSAALLLRPPPSPVQTAVDVRFGFVRRSAQTILSSDDMIKQCLSEKKRY